VELTTSAGNLYTSLRSLISLIRSKIIIIQTRKAATEITSEKNALKLSESKKATEKLPKKIK